MFNPDDLIGRVVLPLTSKDLDLTPGTVNDLWLPVERVTKRRFENGAASGGQQHASPALQQAQGSPHSGQGLPALGDTASTFSGAAAGQPEPPSLQSPSPEVQGSSPLVEGSLLQRTSRIGSTASAAADQLRRVAVAPLEALRSKDCLLHITATYMPLTEGVCSLLMVVALPGPA